MRSYFLVVFGSSKNITWWYLKEENQDSRNSEYYLNKNSSRMKIVTLCWLIKWSPIHHRSINIVNLANPIKWNRSLFLSLSKGKN